MIKTTKVLIAGKEWWLREAEDGRMKELTSVESMHFAVASGVYAVGEVGDSENVFEKNPDEFKALLKLLTAPAVPIEEVLGDNWIELFMEK